MHTYESWLYKNYHRPFTEGDVNGLIVAFDPTQRNALLHQQVSALQERTGFDKRVIAKTDSYTSLLSVAEVAWHEGYEHLTVLTSPLRLSEVDRFLQERIGSAFESVQVVPENAPRLYEADPTQQQTAPQQQAQGPVSLFLVQSNPPLKGGKAAIEEGIQKLLRQKAPSPHFVINSLGIPDRKYELPMGMRESLIRGITAVHKEKMPSLYGIDGLNPLSSVNADIVKKNGAFRMPFGASLSQFIQSTQKLATREIAYIVVPAALISTISDLRIDQSRIIQVSDSDTFSSKHKAIIDLARKIARDCPLKDDKANATNLKKSSLEPEDTFALYIIEACNLALTVQGDELDKKMEMSWGKLDAGTKEFLDELGKATGVGDIVSGVTDIVKTVASVKPKDADKGAQARAYFNQLEAMSFDVIMAANHTDFARFVQSLDI